MSSLERGAIALDEARRNRDALRLPKIDFESYMAAREEDKANVKGANDFESEVVDFFYGEKSVGGVTLPWDKTHENFRFTRTDDAPSRRRCKTN
jgi:hypothetical protein